MNMTASILLALVASVAGPEDVKIDERISARFNRNRPQAVFVMMTDQFLPPKSFDAWAAKNIDGDRLVLRKQALVEFKKRTKATESVAYSVLGDDFDIRIVWLVNGFGAMLQKADLERLAARDEVMYIYPVGSLPPAKQTGRSLRRRSQPVEIEQSERIPWNVTRIGAAKVHTELKITGMGSVVAMFEPGVNVLNAALISSAKWNEGEVPDNGKDDDGNGYIDDTCGYDFGRNSPDPRGLAGSGQNHGTMTTGIVVGNASGARIAIAPGAKFMPIVSGGLFSTLLAFQYAIENGADVVNMSFSIPNLGHTRGLWRLAAEHAVAAGLVLVSGAGNFQQQQKVPVQMRIPEGIPAVICAGGVDQKDDVPSFCSLGPVEWSAVRFYEDYPMPGGLVKPDVCAFPGAGYPIIDPSKTDGSLIDPNNSRRGNSFSGPHVSGVVALMFEANPSLTSMKVKRILEATARDIDPPGKDNRTGSGLLDAYKAVNEALRIKG